MDAALSSGDGGARLWEVLPHFTTLDYASPLSLAFRSAAALQTLPESTRGAVSQAARETKARRFVAIGTRPAENEAGIGRVGVRID